MAPDILLQMKDEAFLAISVPCFWHFSGVPDTCLEGIPCFSEEI